jgi:hypothetical protein
LKGLLLKISKGRLLLRMGVYGDGAGPGDCPRDEGWPLMKEKVECAEGDADRYFTVDLVEEHPRYVDTYRIWESDEAKGTRATSVNVVSGGIVRSDKWGPEGAGVYQYG